MKIKYKILISVAFMIFILSMLCISASAATYYEADGTSATEYEFDASDCNRTIMVKIVDEGGKHLKTVTVNTKRGEDESIMIRIYGYNTVGFESDQGLWETCKLKWSCSNMHTYGEVYFNYYFRTALSKDVMNVTVTMRKFDDVKIIVRHFKQIRDGNDLSFVFYPLAESLTPVITNSGNYIGTSRKFYTGFNLKSGYASSVSGSFSYSWIGTYENCPSVSTSMEYKIYSSVILYTREDLSYYKESEHGTLGYIYNRTVYIDYYYTVNKYAVSYSANGGSGVPNSQSQYYGYKVTIPTTVPTRSGYTFLGYSTSSNATKAIYSPGDTYTMGLNTTLYAVWEIYDYEFSISNLTVTPTDIYQNTVLTIKVRTDSWDKNDAYEKIPVGLYYDSKLLNTQYIDYAAYGIAYVTFYLDVGTVTGSHTIEVRINWSNKGVETNPNNNSISQSISVKKDEYALAIEAITPNGDYISGNTVMTSFVVYNDCERNIIPDTGVSAKFTAYYMNGSEKIIISEQILNSVVIPAEQSNLIYFKWTIPENLAGTEVYCECIINSDGTLKENNLDNNTVTLSINVASKNNSQVANNAYESKAPSGFIPIQAPSEAAGSASWTVWEYENGQFVLKRYGVKISAEAPQISPSGSCLSAVFENGQWTIKSGYGITLSHTIDFTSLSGYTMPTNTYYTAIQSVSATFPEYNYSTADGENRTLYYINGVWCFAENEGADGNERIHFIPVWYPDGNYTVAVTVSQVWTPAGMISATVVSQPIIISGTIFDDYYVGG